MKKIFIFLILIVIVLMTIVFILEIRMSRNSTLPPLNSKTSGFLYQSEKESIPGNYLISSDGFLQDPELPIRYDLNTNKFYCRSTGQEAQQISYYSIGLGNTAMVGAWTQRFAVVCGDNYWIRDGHDWGWKTYGPFQIQK